VTAPTPEEVLANFTGEELQALAERRLDAERRHDWQEIADRAERFWTEVESDPDTNAAFDRLVADRKHLLTHPPPQQRPRRRIQSGEHRDSYGRAALRSELAELLDTPTGERNIALNRAAFRMGQLVADGALDEGYTTAVLEAAGAELGLPVFEARSTVRSGLDHGKGKPR
jgi:hypothetical protein